MNILKIVKKLLLILIVVIGGGFVIFLLSTSSVNKEILLENPDELYSRFGDFGSDEILKKKEVDGGAFQILKSFGTFFPRFKSIKHSSVYSIAYKSDDLTVSGSLVVPKKEGKYPCVIFNRGGNRNYGRLDFRMINKYMTFLAEQGYVVIASNYRGNNGGEGKDELGGEDVQDVLNLIPVLSQIDKADTSRIGIYGHSRGGMMTYKALRESNKFKAAVVLAGTTNAFNTVKNRPELEERVHSQIIPNYKEDKENQLKERSVVFWEDQLNRVPLLMLHGTADKSVDYNQPIELVNKFESIKFPYQFVSYKADDHKLSKNRKDMEKRVIDWFNKYLRDQKAFKETEKIIEIK
ncbi:alpha/beta hydrolase family protein [Tenacibaculum xiamenense]|uniref:alpha/beta hydrolase family protein n=1 Tax=Tenacibaculum xiamenense TaxID=1261553 RepID=UPI00389512FD